MVDGCLPLKELGLLRKMAGGTASAAMKGLARAAALLAMVAYDTAAAQEGAAWLVFVLFCFIRKEKM